MATDHDQVIWISRHQWSLMQCGELPLHVEKDLYKGRRLVVDVEEDADGMPRVQTARIERRIFLARLQRGLKLQEGAVLVRLGDG